MSEIPPLGMEQLSTAMLLLDQDFRVRYANPAAENLFEFSRKTIGGLPINQVFIETGGLIAACEATFTNNPATPIKPNAKISIVTRTSMRLPIS